MRIILVIAFILASTLAYANTEYYDPITGKRVTDISDKKSLAQIKQKFGMSDLTQQIKLKKNEAVRVENGQIVVYDYVKKNKNIADAKKAEKDTKKEKIKVKLGLTEQDWNDLKDAVK